jgi:hypothetical protein
LKRPAALVAYERQKLAVVAVDRVGNRRLTALATGTVLALPTLGERKPGFSCNPPAVLRRDPKLNIHPVQHAAWDNPIREPPVKGIEDEGLLAGHPNSLGN